MIGVLGPWIGFIGGAIAIVWVGFSLVERFILDRQRIEVKVKREGTGIENHEHPHIHGWGFHNLRVRFRLINRSRHPVSISRVILRSKGGDIIGTTCYDTSSLPPRELRQLTLHPDESRRFVLHRERAKSIVRASSIPVLLEAYDARRQVLHRHPFVLGVETLLDENIPAPKDIAEEE